MKPVLGIQQKFPAENTIHGLVAAAAARHPNAVAVCCGEVRLSYCELNRRANRLANRLRQSGVSRDVPVAVCIERSEELIVAMLAILKAGGAYVPIEPANPEERIAFVLEDSRAKLVLTDRCVKDKVARFPVLSLVLEPGGAELSSETETDPVETTGPDGLAYIIYTSGSTGRPKGVLIEHRQVERLFRATEEWFHFNSNDVWTMFHSAAFDFSVWEIWGALIGGGRLVVVPYMVSRSPGDFYELLAREQVTVLNQTPSAFRQLIRTENEMGVQALALRLVIFGGEALDLESLRPWMDRHGDERPQLINMYGITETTVHVTYRRIRKEDLGRGLGSVIGEPIPDLAVYLLDEKQQPVPNGVSGEIYVGGAGLARGYLNRAELTAERFLPDPFDGKPGSRMYRSGDQARRLANGDMEYLGRLDNQVKIRGFRIELGEIESVFRQAPGVTEAAVVAREDGNREKILTAYYTSGCGAVEPSAASLRSYLVGRLPEHMVPSRFVFLDRIPLTINGKVDQRSLPAPGRQRPGLGRPVVAPRTPVESWIASHWEELLNLEGIGVNDPFFELGGTSLKAVRLLGRLSRDTGRSLPTLLLFRAPTIADMARILEQEHRDALPASVIGEVPPALNSNGHQEVAMRSAKERDELRDRRLRRRRGN